MFAASLTFDDHAQTPVLIVIFARLSSLSNVFGYELATVCITNIDVSLRYDRPRKKEKQEGPIPTGRNGSCAIANPCRRVPT